MLENAEMLQSIQNWKLPPWVIYALQLQPLLVSEGWLSDVFRGTMKPNHTLSPVWPLGMPGPRSFTYHNSHLAGDWVMSCGLAGGLCILLGRQSGLFPENLRGLGLG